MLNFVFTAAHNLATGYMIAHQAGLTEFPIQQFKEYVDNRIEEILNR